MDINSFLNKVCNQIKYEPVKPAISEELENHIKDIKEEYISKGLKEKEAEEKAVSQMGEAEEIGKKLNRIHKPKLDWKLLILISILIFFGLLNSFLKNNIEKNIIYLIIGITLSIFIYFFDYRKLNKYSNVIYLIASVITILPLTSQGVKINAVSYVYLFGIKFFPATISLPLYVIAFIGFITNYNENNKLKIQIKNEKFYINKDFIKIISLCIISLVLIISLPSVVNAIILAFIYYSLTIIKIIQDRENRIRKLVLMLIPALCCTIFFVYTFVFIMPYRLNRIVSSFKPELDPQGSGYTGMLQKEILENAKMIGEADTSIISSDDYIITKESNYTFIYLLGKLGLVCASFIVLTIILTSIKLIFNAKLIKNQYGKFLVIGLSLLFIIQSIMSVLMNINYGLKVAVNLPFVTYGGVYFIINLLSMSVILSVYRRKDIEINLLKN